MFEVCNGVSDCPLVSICIHIISPFLGLSNTITINRSIKLKISSFQFETGPGGEDEECLDDGSGEEPEGESESERFEQILESVVKVKVKVKRKVKVKLKFCQQLISQYFPVPTKIWPTTNISILSSAQTSSSQSRLAPRRYL